MRRLVLLVVMVMVLVVIAGCQQPQPGLSKEEARSIVEEEVTSQFRDIVEQEVARQLATIDVLTVSKLYIKNEDGESVVYLGSSVLGGELYIRNANGERAVTLEVLLDGGSLAIYDTKGHENAAIWSDSEGNGALLIYAKDGEYFSFIGR